MMAAETKRKVGAHITRAQKALLQSLLADQPQVRSGKYNSNFTTKDAAKAWQDIANRLNALPGAKKDWKSWRKTWQDMWSKIKAKQAEINRGRRQTGGGPAPPPLNEFEESVASLMNARVVSGHQDSHESAVIFNFDNHVQEEEVNDEVQEVVVYNIVEEDQLPQSDINPSTTQSTREPATRNRKINIKTLLKEKVEIKKKYYEEKLILMKENNQLLHNLNQTLQMISDSFINNSFRT